MGTNLVARVQGILLRPKQEWVAIDAEKTDTATLYRGYIALLAAIGPVATVIGTAVFGSSVHLDGEVQTSTGSALVAVVSYLLTLAGTYIFALIIDALAPSFGGTKGSVQALKVAAYSNTASWVAGIFSLIPALRPLGILGLWSLYLLYTGLPVLMKVPQKRALSYTVVAIIVAVVVFIVIGVVTSVLTVVSILVGT